MRQFQQQLILSEKTGKGIGLVTNDEFVTIGVADESTGAYSMKYILNNGFNPTNNGGAEFTESHLFWGEVRTFGNIRVNGHIYATGFKYRKVSTEHYGDRFQSCYEMATPIFGDIGEAKTDNYGICYISINDIFKETVSEYSNYYVFLQKEGEGDLWVDEKHTTYFVVKGTPNLNFAWELKAKQRDFEYDRLNTTIDDNDKDVDYALLGAAAAEHYYKELEMNEYGEH